MMLRTRSIPVEPTSSSLPTNGLIKYAPALAARRAWPGKRQSVRLARVYSLLGAALPRIPSRVRGHFTTTFLWILASRLPSSTMAANSVATTSALMSPSTMSQIFRTCSSSARPSLAIKVGFVVTPSTMPQLAPFRNSSRLAVSRKNFTLGPSRDSLNYSIGSTRMRDGARENLLYRDVRLPDERARFGKSDRHAHRSGLYPSRNP